MRSRHVPNRYIEDRGSCVSLLDVSEHPVHPRFAGDLAEVREGISRPSDTEYTPTRLAVIGAGMMGAGIAYAAAEQGISITLLDMSEDAAQRGKAYSGRVTRKLVDSGRMTADEAAQVLDRIHTTADYSDIADCDCAIEAVFEDPGVKQKVFRQIAAHAPDIFLTSNTSSLPIGSLSKYVSRPTDFIGTHFFSPVDKMDLVELVVGENTSDAAIAKAFDLGLALGKTPIVVNDARGFYTSRTIGKYLDEALAMLNQGVPAEAIERAALEAGYPVGPLKLVDETSISLARTVRDANREAAGAAWQPHDSDIVLDTMVEIGRPGRAGGGGFYIYDEAGRRLGIWPGLAERFGPTATVDPADIRDRLLFSEAIDTLRCFDEGVLRTPAEANVGSVLGIGYPAWTGGTARFVIDFHGGTAGFIERAKQLQSRYGRRFALPVTTREITARWP